MRLPFGLALVALGIAVPSCAAVVGSAGSPALLGPHGIGTVRFGATKAATVGRLSALFGAPTERLPNTACGPRFREVAWGHLYVEFRAGRFAGYRYLRNGWSLKRAPVATSLVPRLETSRSVTLGDTLGRVRAAYGGLRSIGTDRWESGDGLVFYDNAEHDPVAASSRIVEIKIGTCGDF